MNNDDNKFSYEAILNFKMYCFTIRLFLYALYIIKFLKFVFVKVEASYLEIHLVYPNVKKDYELTFVDQLVPFRVVRFSR